MLNNVQMLRAVAALLVVFVHVARLSELAGYPAQSTFFGNSGVDVFFVISGMIMVMTTADGRATPVDFMRNRISRIAPLYWTITLAVFALALAAPHLLQSTVADPIHLAKSLAFIPFQRGDGEMHPTVFVGWTLNYEMMFYLVFATGLFLPSRRTGVIATVLLLVLAVVAGQIHWPQDPVLQFYLQPIVLEFAAGMLIGLALPHLPKARGWAWPAAAIGLVAFAVMLANGWLFPQAERALIFGIPATVIVASAVIAERSGLKADQPWVQLLGAASYAIYLTHFFCTQALVKVYERLGITGPLALSGFVVALVLVAIVGIIVHRHVELPLTKVARRFIAPARDNPRRRSVAEAVGGGGIEGPVVETPASGRLGA